MKLILFIFLYLTSLISANSLTLIEDSARIIKNGKILTKTDDINIISKIGTLSKVTQSSLKLSKVENIQNLMALAVKEKRVNFVEQFKYIKIYKNMKNGDALLLECLKDKSCNLSKYTIKIQNTYIQDKLKTVKYTIKGYVNDNKIHEFRAANGQIIKGKISEVVDLSRTIKMPYIGSRYENSNAAGYMRDAIKFWDEYKKLYPDVLSKNNMARINANLSPLVDKQWIKYNPNHKFFIGERLEHHHLNNTDITVGVPMSLHRGKNNKELMHVD